VGARVQSNPIERLLLDLWQRRPGLLDAPAPPLTSKRLLQILARLVVLPVGPRVRIFADGRQISAREFATLRISATTFESFIESAMASLHTQDLAVIMDDVSEVDDGLFTWVSDFLAPLLATAGVPADRVETSIFAGVYRETPFGVHRDIGNDNLTFPILGSKEFLVWPEGTTFESVLDPHRIPFDELAQAAERFRLQPGQMLYWPDRYHVGLPSPEVHATLSIGLWGSLSLADFLASLVRTCIQESLGEADEFRGMLGEDMDARLVNAASVLAKTDLLVLARRHFAERIAHAGFIRHP
jgi:hypothetical protein